MPKIRKVKGRLCRLVPINENIKIIVIFHITDFLGNQRGQFGINGSGFQIISLRPSDTILGLKVELLIYRKKFLLIHLHLI